jgi:enoyl-CoA hydratase
MVMEQQRFVRWVVEGPVAIVSMKAERQLNTLNETVLRQLTETIAELSERRDVRVIVLRADGRAFAAGGDIAAMEHMSALEAQELSEAGQLVFKQIERIPQPTIALVHGFALGGGLELAMACDVRLAAEGTKFGQPEVTLGIIPGFGGTQRLPRIVGQGRALWILLSGQFIDAAEAYRIGLVTEVVPAESLDRRGRDVAEYLATLAPHALRMVKQAVYEGGELDLAKGLAMEAELFGQCFATEDQRAGMRAFLEKRKAKYSGN